MIREERDEALPPPSLEIFWGVHVSHYRICCSDYSHRRIARKVGAEGAVAPHIMPQNIF